MKFEYNTFNMKIFSFNVNGLRAAINKGFADWLANIQPDILSLQEIKATPDQVDTSFLDKLGYHHFWFPSEKKGYSGVALFTKVKPDNIVYGMDNSFYDSEGRLIRSDYGNITLLSTYFPSGTSGEVRQEIKMKFLDTFEKYVLDLRKDRPNIIIAGDVNIAHKETDINYPKKHVKMSGFLPEERAWMDRFLAKGFIDAYRVFHNEPEKYSWWTYRAGAREKNLGWRIDYHFISKELLPRLKDADIHADVYQSDHCPVSMEIE